MSGKSKPLRRCVGCGESFEKGLLIRIVHTPEDTYEIDRTGKRNGRGAYLCDQEACLEKALKRHAFDRSFHTKVPEEMAKALREALQNT